MTRRPELLLRLALGAVGVAFALIGAWGILTHQANSPPRAILPWWIAVIVVHDGIIAPVTALTGRFVIRHLPPRVQAPVQFAAIVCGLVTLFAIPLLHRQGRGFEGSTLLIRDYRTNLLAIIATVIVLTALVSLLRTRRGHHAGDPPA